MKIVLMASVGKSKTSKTILGFLAGILIGSSVGCNRVTDGMSVVTIQTPILRQLSIANNYTLQAVSDGVLPVGKKACFGVEVQGPGIPVTGQTLCAPQMGTTSGFVEEGGLLSVQVASGNDRSFRLVVFETDIGNPCPAWSPSFNSSGSPFTNVFEAGKTNGVNLNGGDQNVNIAFTMTSSTSSIANQLGLGTCSVSPSIAQLRGMIFSSGNIVNAQDQPFSSTDLSQPYLSSFFKTTIGQLDNTGLGFATTGGIVNIDNVEVQVDPFVYSFTRKPDTGKVYALTHSGSIVEVLSSGAVSDLSTSCPFVTCEVPVWMQSISVGYNNEVYSLDHAGNIYKLLGTNSVQEVGLAVSPAVTQISYY